MLLFALVGFNLVKGQSNQQAIDSVLLAIPKANDSIKVNLYLELVALTYHSDYSQALAYSQSALMLARSIGYTRAIAGSLMNSATIYTHQERYSEAIEHYELALDAFKANKDSVGIAMCYGNLASLHQRIAEWGKALDYAKQSRSISLSFQDSVGVAISSGTLGAVYKSLGLQDSSIRYYRESLELYFKVGRESDRATTLANLGLAFQDLGKYAQAGKCFQEALEVHQKLERQKDIAMVHQYIGQNAYRQELWDTAVMHFNKSLAFFSELGDQQGQAKSLHSFAQVYAAQGEYEKALSFYRDAIQLKRQQPNQQSLATSLLAIGSVFRKLSMEDSASFYIDRAVDIGKAGDYKKVLRGAARERSLHLQSIGDFEGALKQEEIYSKVTDSMMGASSFASLEQLRADYNANRVQLLEQEAEARKQLLEIEQSESNVQKMIILILALLLGLLVMVLLWRRMRSRVLARESLIKEREIGVLAMIDADHQVREKVSRDLHDGLGQVLAGLKLRMHGLSKRFKVNDPEVIKEMGMLDRLIENAIEEVRTIAYLMIPPLLKERGLVAALEEMLAASIDQEQLKYELSTVGDTSRLPEVVERSLYRVCQELVSNTIKHANATALWVQLIHTKEQILLTVEDNGIGFDYDECQAKGSGLRNMKSRIEALGGKLVVERPSDQGQVTKIRIPL